MGHIAHMKVHSNKNHLIEKVKFSPHVEGHTFASFVIQLLTKMLCSTLGFIYKFYYFIIISL